MKANSIKSNQVLRDFDKLKKQKNNRGMTTTRVILLGFLSAIFIGTILLSLPAANVSGEGDFLTSLFTATTSVCVTGLVVVDTFSHWTLFGKIVILILIQLGGLGIVAFTSAVMLVFRRKITLRDRMMIQDAFSLNNLQGMVRFVKKVIMGTVVVETFGALVYMIDFIPRYGAAHGIWYSFFNSISAFCNAGIDILGPDSLMSFNSNPLVLFNTMMLIVSGGIGFVVWWDLTDMLGRIRKREMNLRLGMRKLSFHTKLVIITTFSLIVTGTILTFIFEYNNPDTIGNMSLGDKLLNSLFQSVTLRTAGFAAVSQGGLRDTSVLMCIVFMIIGGSPVGTAGGIKTITFAVLFFTVLAVIKGRNDTVVFNRKVNEGLIRRALAVTFISIMVFFIFSILLITTNDITLTDAMYEVASAIGTVGLSRGITASLSTAGRIIIIIAMYLGRIGPISMFVAFSNRYSIKNSIHNAEADIIVG